jgi:hypothetical protein
MTKSFANPKDSATEASDKQVGELVVEIQRIGLARFVGRINAGMIDSDDGYRAVERFTSSERTRPLLSRLSHLLVGRRDPMEVDPRIG